MASIEIDDRLLDVLRGRAREKGFGTVEEYVGFVLSELAGRISGSAGPGDLSDDEEKAIQDRLRSLGYLE
jgi:hypothetical protein